MRIKTNINDDKTTTTIARQVKNTKSKKSTKEAKTKSKEKTLIRLKKTAAVKATTTHTHTPIALLEEEIKTRKTTEPIEK